MSGSARPGMRDSWDEFKAAKSACFATLGRLSAYRTVLRRMNAWCPHVDLADDELPDVDVRFPDLSHAIGVWEKNGALAERAVRDAEDELTKVIAKAQAQGKRPMNFGLHTFDIDLLLKTQQPSAASSGARAGGSFFA